MWYCIVAKRAIEKLDQSIGLVRSEEIKINQVRVRTARRSCCSTSKAGEIIENIRAWQIFPCSLFIKLDVPKTLRIECVVFME